MKRILYLVVLAGLILAAPAMSSTFIAMSDEELVRDSQAIVEGQVLRVHSFWDETNSVIVTEAVVSVTDSIRGNAPAVVAVRTYGGEVGNYKIEAHGFPQFSAGDRVVLFLGERKQDVFSVTGYQLGHYSVRKDARGNDVAVPTLEPGVRLFERSGAAASRPASLPLEELKSRIRGLERNLPPLVR